jgi:hypothetical protein
MESFRDYVSTENLIGDNRYDAGPHGLQVSYFFVRIKIWSGVSYKCFGFLNRSHLP